MMIGYPERFFPRALKNLSLVQEIGILNNIDNMASISDIKCTDLTNEGNAQIYALCSANHRSTLRILRHGLAVSELAVSDLPATPNVIEYIDNQILNIHITSISLLGVSLCDRAIFKKNSVNFS